MRVGVAALMAMAVLLSGIVQAASWSQLPKKKQTSLGLYMSAAEAYKMVNKNPNDMVFLDIRTRAEVNFLGAPTLVDANIPYMKLNEWYAWNEKNQNFKMEVNSDFADDVAAKVAEKGLSKQNPIILICRSGTRSSKAADLLAKLGYTQVYSVVDGFEGDKAKQGKHKGQRVVNGWKNAGLPWSYKLVKAKMYKVGGDS
ncbi:MAG: rhodanese-like domain-containing protein [Gammaproteobacteria bacterium]|nr:rhodanese-like domain-containing protein [Gammaproteobacteria bacterium]MDH5799824.1 rhodanese-like domain-containing protein [Gammaproteobacteria bacterium]